MRDHLLTSLWKSSNSRLLTFCVFLISQKVIFYVARCKRKFWRNGTGTIWGEPTGAGEAGVTGTPCLLTSPNQGALYTLSSPPLTSGDRWPVKLMEAVPRKKTSARRVFPEKCLGAENWTVRIFTKIQIGGKRNSLKPFQSKRKCIQWWQGCHGPTVKQTSRTAFVNKTD